MTTYGPHVSYIDPRIYGLVEHYAWGPHQREMLLGTRPWEQTQSAVSIVNCLLERGIQVARDAAGTAWIHMDGLPPGDAMLPTMLAQWGIAIPRVSVLSLHGPVEEVGTVPIFRAVVFGHTERADGQRRDGLNHAAWIVGRHDVRLAFRRDDGVEPWWPTAGPSAIGNRAVRGTLLRARNTAARVSERIADWDAWCAWKARKDAEAARRAPEASEPVDEGLLDVEF